MITAPCPNCNGRKGFKRNLGFGTFFAVILTCGFWLAALPFYPKRCIGCGTPFYSVHKAAPIGLIIILVIVAFLFFKLLGPQ